MRNRPRHLRKNRGIAILTALLVVFVVGAWVTATVLRVHTASGFTRWNDVQAVAHYQAKTGVSRALAAMNEQAGWLAAHSGRSSADTSLVQGGRVWTETVPGQPNSLILCATVQMDNGLSETVTVILNKDQNDDTKFFAVAPTAPGQPDVIAWSSANSDTWSTLPPVPGNAHVESVTSTPSGDLYAVVNNGSQQGMWRFRGGSWMQLPTAPNGAQLSMLTASGDDRLVGLGSDQKLYALNLSPLGWKSYAGPSGFALSSVATDPQAAFSYAVVEAGSGPVVYQFNHGDENWQKIEAPTATAYDASKGSLLSPGTTMPVKDMSGGIAVSSGGEIFVASNPPGQASVVYRYTPGKKGTDGMWLAQPPIPQLSWNGSVVTTDPGYLTAVDQLHADNQGRIWLRAHLDNGQDHVVVFNADNQTSVSGKKIGTSTSSSDSDSSGGASGGTRKSPKSVHGSSNVASDNRGKENGKEPPPDVNTDDPPDITPWVIDKGAASAKYGLFSLRPEYSYDPGTAGFQESATVSTQDQKTMGVGIGTTSGNSRFVPVAEL